MSNERLKRCVEGSLVSLKGRLSGPTNFMQKNADFLRVLIMLGLFNSLSDF